MHTLVETAIHEFRAELGIWGGRLYQREGSRYYTLLATFADALPLPPGLKVPRTYPPIARCLMSGVVYVGAEDPAIDPRLEARLGVKEFACIEVDAEEYILAFNVAPGFDSEEILYSLGILRHAINQRIRYEHLQEVFRQARRIHQSILPSETPDFGRFEFACRSDPMESVGGDYYDYIPITDKILGLAVADVTGHGLPAALQVRDIYTGLRMGLSRDFKIVRTVERLNDIIHQSTLTSRFVSMVYGELEKTGNFTFVNAGHPPPYLLRADGRTIALNAGGTVLGPVPGATYERGFERLEPGDVLLLYTDGVVETRGWPAEAQEGRSTAKLQEYGVERLLDLARKHQKRPARELVDAVFEDLVAFRAGRPVADDVTLVVVRCKDTPAA